MFERLADFWDIVIFGFILLMLASLQLRHASYAEVILALAAIVFGVGLLLAKKWALIGTYITLLLGLAVYFAQIWFEPIMTGKGIRLRQYPEATRRDPAAHIHWPHPH